MTYDPATSGALDEAAAGSRDFARIMRAQFEGFIEAGFTEAQALALTQTVVAAQFGAKSP